jgi:hypothetical protein
MISNEHSITSSQFTLQNRVVTICTTKFLIQEPALHPRSIYVYTTLNNSHNKLRSLNTFIRLISVTETERVFCETGNILNYFSEKFQFSNGNIKIRQADKHYRSHKFQHSPRNTVGWLWFVQTLNAVTFCGPLRTSAHMRIATLNRRS